MRNAEEVKQEVIEWLMHPNELGSKPFSIIFTRQFTTADGIECMIFKFKRSMLSPWLLAIASDSGIFSEQQKYNPATEVADAVRLIEFLKQFWINKANEEKERQERAKKSGVFAGFMLLKDPVWDAEQFKNRFEAEWGMKLYCDDKKEDTKLYLIPEAGINTTLAISLIDAPVPGDEAVYNAQYNYMWREAVQVTKSHTAHLIVTVFGGSDPIDAGVLFVQAVTSICRDENTLGAYYNGVVMQPQFLIATSEVIKSKDFPLWALVWFGAVRTPNGNSVYTNGLAAFGKDEMEILDSTVDFNKLRDFMFNISLYVIGGDVILHDGETIGGDNRQRLKIRRSEGVNVSGMSLKIEYAS